MIFAINVKISKVGGLTKARQIRDLCVALRVPMEIQDSSYSEIACSVVAHMGHSTPDRAIRSVINAKGLLKETVQNAAVVENGRVRAPDLPGIGTTPLMHVIGEPIAVFE